MNDKELTAAAKASAKASARYASYVSDRVTKRIAFDAETERVAAELREEMLVANGLYRVALDEIVLGPAETTADVWPVDPKGDSVAADEG